MTELPQVQLLNRIVSLAEAGRAARVGYRRAGDSAAAQPTAYVVEPYALHRAAEGPVLRAWQLSPPPEGRAAWRDFRLDRIASVEDAGQAFTPRAPVTLSRDAADAGANFPASVPASASTSAAAPVAPGPAASPRPSPFAAFSDQPLVPLDAAEEYFRQVEAAMLDGQITPDEMELSRELGGRVDPDRRKAVHARVYANVLREVVADGRISHREELYLRQVRELLQQLGWTP